MILLTPGQDEGLYPTENDPEVSALNQKNPDPSKYLMFASAHRTGAATSSLALCVMTWLDTIRALRLVG